MRKWFKDSISKLCEYTFEEIKGFTKRKSKELSKLLIMESKIVKRKEKYLKWIQIFEGLPRETEMIEKYEGLLELVQLTKVELEGRKECETR